MRYVVRVGSTRGDGSYWGPGWVWSKYQRDAAKFLDQDDARRLARTIPGCRVVRLRPRERGTP